MELLRRVAAVIAAGLLSLQVHATELVLVPPAESAQVTLPDLEGRQVALHEMGGQVVLVHFWATWCPPCIEELPSLQALRESHRDAGLEVIAVAADSRKAVLDFIERFPFELPVVIDAYGDAMHAYRVRGLPTTIVLDRNGSILGRAIGQIDWEDPGVIQRLESLL